MAVDQPWNGDASRFTDAQYERSCVLDRSVCGSGSDVPPKTRCSLPIREPGGAVNVRAVAAAAQRLSQVDACPAAKSRAARAIVAQYRALSQLGDPPQDVVSAAGGSSMSPADHLADVKRG